MLRTNSKKARENVRNYILKNVHFEGYDDAPAENADFPEIAKAVIKIMLAEMRYQRGSKWQKFQSWAAGLPTVLDTCYHYNVSAVDLIGEWLEETETEKARYSEEAAEQTIDFMIFRELEKGECE